MNRTAWPIAFFLLVCLLAGQWWFSTEVANAAPPADGPLYHVVKRGESLFYLGRLYGVDPWLVAELNGIWSPSEIYVGQRLFIPDGGYYSPYPCYKYQPAPQPYYSPYGGYAPDRYYHGYAYDAPYPYYSGPAGGYGSPYGYDLYYYYNP